MNPAVPEASGAESQLHQLELLLSGSNSILAVLAILAVAVLVYLVKPAKWWAIAVLLDVSSFAQFGYTSGEIIGPLKVIRLYGRPICAGILLVLLIPTFLSERGWRLRLVLPSTAVFLLFELCISICLGISILSLLDFVTFVLIFLTLGVGLSRWLQSLDDAENAVKAICFAGVLFLIGSIVQYAVDPTQVIWMGRFFGTTGNANHCGALLAVTLLATLYLMLRPATRLVWRALYCTVAVTNIVFLLWTGSRTAMLIALVGVGVQFRRRLGSLAIVGLLGAIIGLFVWQSVSGDSGMTRGFTFADTRSEIWQVMLNEFFASPIVGNGTESVGSENSFLATASRAGLVGLIPLLCSMALLAATLWRLAKSRHRLRQFSALSDLVLAAIASLLAGAMFEGFLTGVYTLTLLSLYIYFSLAGFLSDVNVIAAQRAFEDAEPVDYPTNPEVSLDHYAGQVNY